MRQLSFDARNWDRHQFARNAHRYAQDETPGFYKNLNSRRRSVRSVPVYHWPARGLNVSVRPFEGYPRVDGPPQLEQY